jgi:Putative Na+/H+ antiporter
MVVVVAIVLSLVAVGSVVASGKATADAEPFPRSLDSYGDENQAGIMAVLKNRIRQEPFNLVATIIFLCAIIHTFLTHKFMVVAHEWELGHKEKIKSGLAHKHSVHHGAELFHFLGEVEVVFGLWAVALGLAILFFYDWHTVVHYLSQGVNFTEPMFVVVIMALASTRPILKLAELVMARIARLLGGSLVAWWFTILTLGPTLGSFITEPAAMTISALLLGNKFYELEPGNKFKYATLGLLFVNISVGGTLTHFAAPPVLMVAGLWNWDLAHMLSNFGWKAIIGMLISNGLYFFVFRSELARLQEKFARRELKSEIQNKFITRRKLEAEVEKISLVINKELGVKQAIDQQTQALVAQIKNRLESEYLPSLLGQGFDADMVREVFEQRFHEIRASKMNELYPGLLPEDERPAFVDPEWDERDDPVPGWVTTVHVLFMAWTIINAHHPALFIPGMLFFLGFAQVTSPYQNRINLIPPLLVGFFLGGLVTHGGVQGWWIAPVLGSLEEIPLMIGATLLTAFNDNAAITYLSTLVPGFTDNLKYAVVAGAVSGGGLTIIANAPNPAGQSMLKRYFGDSVSPVGLLKAAIIPTLIMLLCFLIFQ